MITSNQIQQFAELGRLALDISLINFAESITDVEVLSGLKDLLSEEAGDIDRVYDVTLDGKTFSGKADQRYGLAKVQTYSFAISPTTIEYQILNAAEMAEYAESEQGWTDIIEFAAAKGKKLNCKPGNVQCGGKCQNGKFRCTKNPSPDQAERVESLVEKTAKNKKSKPKTGKDKSSAESTDKAESTSKATQRKNLEVVNDIEKIEQWRKLATSDDINALAKKVRQWENTGQPPTTELERRIIDNADTIGLILLDGDEDTFRGVQDEEGNLQAGAVVQKLKGEMYVDALATAPWNMEGTDPKSTKGAGTKLLYEIAKEAVASNRDVTLASAPRAKTFYEKIGFSTEGAPPAVGDIKMRLNVDAARSFIKKMESSESDTKKKSESKPKSTEPKSGKTTPKPIESPKQPDPSTANNANRFDVVKGGQKAKLIKELKELEAEARAQADQSPQALANFKITEGIRYDIERFGSKGVRQIRDKNGVLQATAVVIASKNDGYVVDLLATSPHNLNASDPRYTKGAGTAAMEQIMLESIRESNGEVRLTALPGAISFYEKIGFKTTSSEEEVVTKMAISKSDAEKFLRSRGITNFADEKNLEDLEAEAYGAFAVNTEVWEAINE